RPPDGGRARAAGPAAGGAAPVSEAVECPVRRHAEQQPEAPAVVTPEAVWTWADLDREVMVWAAHLTARVPAGIRVAALAETTPRFVAFVLAALRTGHVLAPLSPHLPEAAAREHLHRIACEVLLDLDDRHRPSTGAHRPSPIP